jgi:hypothetical protein
VLQVLRDEHGGVSTGKETVLTLFTSLTKAKFAITDENGEKRNSASKSICPSTPISLNPKYSSACVPNCVVLLDDHTHRDADRLRQAAPTGRRVFGTPPTAMSYFASPHTKTGSPDGSRVVSVGSDGTIRLWNATTGEELIVIHTFADDQRAIFINGELASCIPGAWRWMGWLAPDPTTGQLTRYPAETYGPLPVGC